MDLQIKVEKSLCDFSTYAIGSVSAGHVVRGSDTITYSDKATINLRTKKIDMMYRHDNDSTNAVRIELYIVGEKSNLLVAESGIIPVGYDICLAHTNKVWFRRLRNSDKC